MIISTLNRPGVDFLRQYGVITYAVVVSIGPMLVIILSNVMIFVKVVTTRKSNLTTETHRSSFKAARMVLSISLAFLSAKCFH